MQRPPRRLLTVAAFLASLHALLAYGLPVWLFALLLLALGLLFWRQGPLAAVSIALSLVAVTLLYAAVIPLAGLDQAMYYRPHERLVTWDYEHGHRAYRRHQTVDMIQRHGDLQAMTREAIGTPRPVRFQTDGAGFRNDRDYHGQRLVLVGDSFVAAVGDSQEHTLDAQLRRDHGLDAYNLGHPGSLADYLAYVEAFRTRHGPDFDLALFLFEGNDFPDTLPEPKGKRFSTAGRWVKRYYGLFSETSIYRLTQSLRKRASGRQSVEKGTNVRVLTWGAAAGHPLAGTKMAFYEPYVAVALRADYAPDATVEQALLRLRPQLRHVYFIPTKFRVYADLTGADRLGATGAALPEAQWRYLEGLCRRQGLACTDLTGPLVTASRERLAQGELTYWADDSHWNRHGMAVAARRLAHDFGEPPTAAARGGAQGRRRGGR